MMFSDRPSSHARQTCADVASWALATREISSVMSRLRANASGVKRGFVARKSPSSNPSGVSVPVR